MGIISWIILGLIAGFIASKIVNKTGSGMLMDIALGVIGAIVGGFLASFFGIGGVTGVNIGSIIIAVIGAVVVLLVYRAVAHGPDAGLRRRRSSAPPTARHPPWRRPSLDGAVDIDGALPERRAGLEVIHQHFGGRERRAAMRRRNRDQDDPLARRDPPVAVNDRHPEKRPARLRFVRRAGDLLLGHARIMLELERREPCRPRRGNIRRSSRPRRRPFARGRALRPPRRDRNRPRWTRTVAIARQPPVMGGKNATSFAPAICASARA